VLDATTDNVRTSPHRPPWGALINLPLTGASRIRLHVTKFSETNTWTSQLSRPRTSPTSVPLGARAVHGNPNPWEQIRPTSALV
jgi:hypothetical protein